jgi:hypothetical protein
MNDERLGQGIKNATQWVSENPEMILEPIEEVLKTTGYSTTNKEVEEAIKLAEAEEAEEQKIKTSVKKGRGKKNE